MPLPKSITYTATQILKGGMLFSRKKREDGYWWVTGQQAYQFGDSAGNPVPGIQIMHEYGFEIKEDDLREQYPAHYDALARWYGWFDEKIREQEGLL